MVTLDHNDEDDDDDDEKKLKPAKNIHSVLSGAAARFEKCYDHYSHLLTYDHWPPMNERGIEFRGGALVESRDKEFSAFLSQLKQFPKQIIENLNVK